MIKGNSNIQVLSMRQRAELIHHFLRERLNTILPLAMRENGFDMWIILCQEDNLDPVFSTMIPMDTWCPILQVLVFFEKGRDSSIECINISGTKTHDLYDRPYKNQIENEQWHLLKKIVEERDPKHIGINIGNIQWASGGLTYNLYEQLTKILPQKYISRLTSAEPMVTCWLSTLTDYEIEIYKHVINVAHCLISECYSRTAIIPNITTLRDLEWHWWQRCSELGLDIAFSPSFYLIRNQSIQEKLGKDDIVIRPGDLIRCDLGIKYLRLNSDNQQWAYILRNCETDVPNGIKKIMEEANKLQDIFISELKCGLTGDEILKNILKHAHSEGLSNPEVFSHSIGLLLHEPGPLIGLPWEQNRNPGRGDVKLKYNNAFAMELSVSDYIPEWNDQEVKMSVEEIVVFTKEGCHFLDGRQTEFYVI